MSVQTKIKFKDIEFEPNNIYHYFVPDIAKPNYNNKYGLDKNLNLNPKYPHKALPGINFLERGYTDAMKYLNANPDQLPTDVAYEFWVQPAGTTKKFYIYASNPGSMNKDNSNNLPEPATLNDDISNQVPDYDLQERNSMLSDKLLTMQKEQYDNLVRNKDQEIENLKKLIETINTQIADGNNTFFQLLKNKEEQFMELMREKDSRINELQNLVIEANTKLATMTGEKIGLENSFKDLQTKHETLQNDYDSLDEEHNTLSDNFETVSTKSWGDKLYDLAMAKPEYSMPIIGKLMDKVTKFFDEPEDPSKMKIPGSNNFQQNQAVNYNNQMNMNNQNVPQGAGVTFNPQAQADSLDELERAMRGN